jgi:hypothetical protein
VLTYVDARLNEWALWKAGARVCTGGAVTSNAYTWIGAGGRGDNAPPPLSYVPLDELACAETDRCVCALEPLLRQVVEEFYCRLGTTDMAAARCGCSRMTLWRRLDNAHNRLLGFMNDVAAGLEVKPWAQTAAELGIVTTPVSARSAGRAPRAARVPSIAPPGPSGETP